MSLENIFSDKVLVALSEALPQDIAELEKIAGLTTAQRQNFGANILNICSRGTAEKRSLDSIDADADAPDAKRLALSDGAQVPLPESINPSQLTPEQLKWADRACAGESLFLTGEAGTGKSFLLTYIVQELKKTKNVAVTATTGIVAASLGGVTVHSFAGVGLGKGPQEEVIARTLKSRDAVNRWQETEVLVIDELSMMDGSLFTLLEELARRTSGGRENW